MKVISFGVINGVFCDEFGKRGTEFLKQMPTYSIPFTILDAPNNTKSFAFILEDPDAVGGLWIHWLGANIKKTSIEEDESKCASFVQGANSWHDRSGYTLEEASRYGGMAPPDKDHTYELTVYALDIVLDINQGFKKKELEERMKGHILQTAKLRAVYKN